MIRITIKLQPYSDRSHFSYHPRIVMLNVYLRCLRQESHITEQARYPGRAYRSCWFLSSEPAYTEFTCTQQVT